MNLIYAVAQPCHLTAIAGYYKRLIIYVSYFRSVSLTSFVLLHKGSYLVKIVQWLRSKMCWFQKSIKHPTWRLEGVMQILILALSSSRYHHWRLYKKINLLMNKQNSLKRKLQFKRMLSLQMIQSGSTVLTSWKKCKNRFLKKYRS